MRRNIDNELVLSNVEPLTAEQLVESVKSRFVGTSNRVSPRREELQNLGALAAAGLPTKELLSISEPEGSQLAVVFFPQIEELGRQFDAQVQIDNATPAEIAQIVTAVRTEQHFRIPDKFLGLASIVLAMLLLLATVTTACAAENPANPQIPQLSPQPALYINAPQPPVLGGAEGEMPAPTEIAAAQSCVFDSARNLRTGPSATAPKTTLDGSGTTVAGKEYECLEVVENTDNSVWVRISEQPDVWAVIEHPALGLTGSITTKKPAEAAPIEAQTTVTTTSDVESSTIFDTQTQQALINEYNSIAPDLKLGVVDTVIQAVDGSILYLKNGQAIATSRQIDGVAGTPIVVQLFAIDSSGKIAQMPVAENSGMGWKSLDNASTGAGPNDAAINTSTALTSTDTIGATNSSELGAKALITEALQPHSPEQEAMNDLLPANFAEKLQEKGITSINFDTASSLYHVVDKDGQEFYFVPQAAPAAEGDGSADFENGFFMGTTESWMHLKAGKVTLDMLFLVDPKDKVLDCALDLDDMLNGGGDGTLSEAVIRAIGMDPEVEKAITVVIAQSGLELTALTPPEAREGELPNVLKSNDSRQRVFVVGPNKYVSVGYMLRAGSTEGETYINLLKNYIKQGAPDEYIATAILLTRYFSRHAMLLFDTFGGSGMPSNPNELLDALRALVRDGEEGYKAAATAHLKSRAEIAEWLH